MQPTESPRIQVYILCYNRTAFVTEAITSVINQTYQNFEIVISDNSTNSEVYNILKNTINLDNLNRVKYIKRQKSVSSIEHHNLILSEVTAPFFMMFHDDDVLEKNALEKLVTGFSNSRVAAVGANGFIINNTEVSAKLFNPYLRDNLLITSPEQLASHHLISTKGIVPFPVYLYRTSIAQKLKFIYKEGHKYSDASFLLKLSESGLIFWLAEPLINYRRHSENGSVQIDIRATISLCRFVKQNYNVSEKIINEFKMKNLSLWSLQKNRGVEKPMSRYREAVIKKSSLVFLLKNPKLILAALKKKILRNNN